MSEGSNTIPKLQVDNEVERLRRVVVHRPGSEIERMTQHDFERLLFEASGRDADAVKRMMESLKQSGAFTLDEEAHGFIHEHFSAGRASEDEVAQTIAAVIRDRSYMLDPHTAVGVHVARQTNRNAPMVVLGTAHPAKFPDAVEAACGIRPPLPPKQKDLMMGKERFTVLPNVQADVETYVAEHTRARK